MKEQLFHCLLDYIGSLKSDRKSNLYEAVNYWENQYEDLEGQWCFICIFK